MNDERLNTLGLLNINVIGQLVNGEWSLRLRIVSLSASSNIKH